MHPDFLSAIASQRIAELHQDAAHQNLVRQLRAARSADGRTSARWARFGIRRARPAVA
jgi:hypothetical protein